MLGACKVHSKLREHVLCPNTGNWISALKAILKSVYGYFSYDIDSYIASELEMQSAQPRSHGRQNESSSDTEEGGADEVGERNSSSEAKENPNEMIFEQTAEQTTSIIRNAAPKLQKTPSNKTISSFTVENILMGKQSPNSCSSSTSVSSHSPTSSAAASLPSPTPLGPISSSIVGVNWVSHPPVKYTKFTILSPTAMSNDAKRKKFTDASSQSSSARLEESTGIGRSSPADYRNSNQVPQRVYARQTSSEASMSSTPLYSLSSLSAAFTPGEPPTSTPSATICTLPVVTTLQPSSSGGPDGKVVMSKSFPPPQQYVLLMPSTSATAAVTSAVHSVPLASAGFAQTVPIRNVKHPNVIGAVSFQNSPASTATGSSSSSSHRDLSSSSFSGGGNGERLERASINSRHSNEYNFRLIAPKQKHRVSGNSNTARGRSKLRGRVPQKLRFHMTTVVTKQKKVPVKSSMTVESPFMAAVGSPQNVNTARHTSRGHHSVETAGTGSLPVVETMITRSPNVYSSVPSKVVKEEAQGGDSPPPCAEEGPSQNGTRLSPSSSYRTGLTDDLHTAESTRHKDSPENSLSQSRNREPIGTPRHRGRATRSYTRRKKELTFHLYEDPGTAYRAKRACKE